MFKVVPAGHVPAHNAAQGQPAPTPTPAQEALAKPPAATHDSGAAVPEPKADATPPKDIQSAPKADISPQFAELARKESAVRKVATTLKAQRAQFEQDQKAFEASLTSDPFAALAAKGWTAEKLVETAILRGVKPPGVPEPTQANPEIAALKAELEALKKGSEKAVDTQYQAALKQIERDAIKLADAPEYPTVKARGASKDVVELVEKHFKATGEVMPTQEAMQLVEDALIEEGLSWAQLESVKAKLSPPPAPKAEEPPSAAPGTPAALEWKAKKTGMPAKIVSSSSPAKNLTHNLNSTPRPKTARERAIAIAIGQDPDA